MATQRTGGFEDGFLDLVEEQLKRCRQELRALDEDVKRLQEQRADAAKRVAQLENLLRANRPPDEDESAEPSSVPTPKPRGPIADADAVIALIRESGRPMHYQEIHETLVGRGYEIGGEGSANTLLSRFFNDERLVRRSRGTYDLANREASKTYTAEPADKAVRARSQAFDLRPSRLEIPLSPAKLTKGMGLREMAAEVLRQAGKCLHYQKITKQILDSGVWQPVTETPWASVRSAMGTDIKHNGANSLFASRRGTGIYSLREWEDSDQHTD